MLRLYIQLRLRSLGKLCKELNIFVPLIISIVFFIGGTFLNNTPKYYIVVTAGVFILSWHLTRRDKTFLQTNFEQRYLGIYMLDYLLLATPFIVTFLIDRLIIEAFTVLLLSILIPFIPKKDFPFRLPTLPFLMKGGYMYQRMGRIISPFYLATIIVSRIGVYVHNKNLVLVTNLLTTMGVGMFVYIPLHKPYIFNFLSAAHLLKLKSKLAFWNAGAILMPLLFCLLLVNFS